MKVETVKTLFPGDENQVCEPELFTPVCMQPGLHTCRNGC